MLNRHYAINIAFLFSKWQLITVICLITLNLFSQPLQITNYSVKDGLSTNNVYDCFKDKQGFLWVATDYGVNRFDGKDFIYYNTSNGLPNNIILSVAQKKDETIVLGSSTHGLITLTPKATYTRYNNMSCHRKILIKDSLLITYVGANIFFIANLYTHKVYYSSTLEFNNIILSDNNIIGCGTNGLYEYRNYSFFKIPINHFNKKTYTATVSNNQSIWVSTGTSLYEIKNHIIIDSIKIPIPKNQFISQICIDSKHRIWCSSNFPAELFCYEKKGQQYIQKKLHINFKPKITGITTIINGSENDIWLGTSNQGLYRFSDIYTESYINEYVNIDPYISSIFNTTENKTIIGNYNGTYLVDSDGVLKKTDTLSHFSLPFYYGFEQKKNQILAFSSEPTNYYYTKFNHYTFSNILAKSYCFINDSLLLTGEWHSTLSSFKISINKPRPITKLNSKALSVKNIENNRICAIAKINDTICYLGTDFGLYTYHIYKNICNKLPIGDIKINTLQIIGKHVFIGTPFGLYTYYDNHLNYFSNLKNYPLGEITSITTGNRKLFIGTTNGLFIITNNNIKHLNSIKETGSNYITKLYYDKIQEKLFVSTNNGYYILYIHLFNQDVPNAPKLLVNGLLVQDSIYNTQQTIILNHTQNNFTLFYTAICFSNSNELIFSYKIDNRDWQTTTAKNINFAELSYGEHLISLKAGIFQNYFSPEQSIKIIILPPFYKTWWFIGLIITLIFVLIYVLIRTNYQSKLKKQVQKNAIEQQLNTFKFQALNASINPHFVFNSLNSIQAFINTEKYDLASSYLAKFAYLIRMVISKAKENYVTIAYEEQFLGYYLELEKMRFGSFLNYNINIHCSIDKEHSFIPNMIIQPLIENALLHGLLPQKNENGKIEVIITKANDAIIIEVSDNGIGINKSNNQKQNKQSKFHTSIGLNNIKERLETINHSSFQIMDKSINQPLTNGTTIIITLPLKTIYPPH